MKKIVVSTLAVALGAVPTAFAARNDAYGHTFYTVRPQFQSEMPEKISGVRHLAKRRMDGCWGGGYIQAVPFGGRSLNGKNLGKYFSPYPTNTLTSFTVAGAGTANDINARLTNRQVNPAHFNISYATSFTSTFSFSPRETVVGAGFEWRQYLGFWRDDCCEPRWWFSLAGPVERVTNDMRLTETFVGTGPLGASSAPSITAAFTGTIPYSASVDSSITMNFGKIDGKQKKTGFADLEFKVGYDWIFDNCAYLTSYIGFVAPTGNKPKGVYMFESIVGNNKHWGVMTGGYLGFDIWQCGNHELYFEVAANTRYLFQNTQVRSFDLKNRPWSRYMLAYASAADAAVGDITPGINLFTRSVKVNPHFQFNMTQALVYNHCGFNAEVGYNFWARQEESVKLATPSTFPSTISIFGFGGAPDTNLLSNISINNSTSDIPQTTGAGNILTTDIDYNSMSHPAALSHIVYGALGYNWDWCWPIYLGVGGSYEFSTNNVALTRWLAWGKLAVSI